MSHITRVVCYTTFGQLMIRLQPVLSSASVLCFRGSELIQQGEPHICLSKLMHSLFMREWSQINWKQIENNLKEGELFWYSCCWQLATVVYSQNFRRNGANGNSTKENSQLWFTINCVNFTVWRQMRPSKENRFWKFNFLNCESQFVTDWKGLKVSI